MSITKNMPLNWYSSMKKKFRKIRTIFDIENWLWKSEIGIFWSLNLERTLIYQKKFFMKKCYFLSNKATIWCGSCWKILKSYLTNIYSNFHQYGDVSKWVCSEWRAWWSLKKCIQALPTFIWPRYAALFSIYLLCVLFETLEETWCFIKIKTWFVNLLRGHP